MRRPLLAALLIAALAAPACAPLAPARNGEAAAPVAALFDPARTLEDVRVLSADDMEGRAPGTPGSAKAREFLVARLAEEGFTPVILPFTFHARRDPITPRDGVNLWVVVPGRDPSGPAIAVTAHYDHLGVVNGEIYNGADDNASGVGAVLALARALKRKPPRHTIHLLLLDAEESGLRGARALLDAPPPGFRADLNVNFDMLSKNDRDELYAAGAYHTPALKPVLDEVAARAPVTLLQGHDRPELGQDDWTGQSDHAVFHARGIPFVYFGVQDHPEYHRPTDVFETIPQDFYLRAVATVIDAVYALDEALETVTAGRAR